MKKKEPSKREQVIDIIDFNIKTLNLNLEQTYKSMKSKPSYQMYKEQGYFDDLINLYISSMGLRFEISFRELGDWRKESDNSPIPQLGIWEKIIISEVEGSVEGQK
jgi:hypothetical protein